MGTDGRAPRRWGGDEIRIPPVRSVEGEVYGTNVRIQLRLPGAPVKVVGSSPGPVLNPIPVSSRSVFRGNLVELRLDRVRVGKKTRQREVVVHPGAVAIVAVTDNREIVLVRQYRHAVAARLYEIPAGTLERDERPLQCAQRELAEETGYQAEHWELLGEIYSSPGFCTEKIWVYLARGLRSGTAVPDDDEELHVRLLPWTEIRPWVREGRLADGKSLAAILMAGWALEGT